jgi:uncharacterized protein YfcZ (UPF0381/DUF406 family)
MPKAVSDYTKNVIYKIQHNDNDTLLYVGHTTNFTKRKQLHKSECKLSQKFIYKMIRENGGWECFTMIVIKIFPCETKMEACIEEDRIMREMKTSMNTKRAYTTPEEKREYHKDYYQSNRELISEKEKIKYQANKEQFREKTKVYRLANRDTINEKQREKVECDCGCTTSKINLVRHKKTKKHLNNLK